MALLDLLTRQDLEPLAAKLDALLALLAQPVQTAADDFLSIEEVAAYTRFDRRTVEQWRKEGRYNERGKKVYLPAYEYSSRLRFKRGDVEAFGLGVGVLEPRQWPASALPRPSLPPRPRSLPARKPPLWRLTRRCGWSNQSPFPAHTMDLNSLTTDEFDKLTPSHHREALWLYGKAINQLIGHLATVADKDTAEFDTERDQLLIWMQRRKVHEIRLIELTQEAEENQSQLLQQAA